VDDFDPASYDEFASLGDLATGAGVDWDPATRVSRRTVPVSPDGEVSVIVWGTGNPDLVFFHGSGQNAHTWDLVTMILSRSALAVDLPGHGHSSWRADRDYSPFRLAQTVAEAGVIKTPHVLVGMSRGGMTAVRFAARQPDLVTRLVLVDTTPAGPNRSRPLTLEQRGQTALLDGPRTFDTFDEMVAATSVVIPGRPLDRIRRGVINNAKQLPDGRWTWRYDRVHDRVRSPGDTEALWRDVESLIMPVLLLQGGNSWFVQEENVDEFARRCADFRHVVVPDSGHAVQSDQPFALARHIAEFCAPVWL
jgi:esterase